MRFNFKLNIIIQNNLKGSYLTQSINYNTKEISPVTPSNISNKNLTNHNIVIDLEGNSIYESSANPSVPTILVLNDIDDSTESKFIKTSIATEFYFKLCREIKSNINSFIKSASDQNLKNYIISDDDFKLIRYDAMTSIKSKVAKF